MARGGINKALVQKAYQAILLEVATQASTRYGLSLEILVRRPPFTGISKSSKKAPAGTALPPLNEQLANLVGQLSDQLKADAQASVAKEREQLGQERIRYQALTQQAEARSLQLEDQCKELSDQLKATQQALVRATPTAGE